MARVLFVMKYPLHRRDNLQVKFDGQMKAVRALGHEALCIGWNEDGLWLLGEGTQSLLFRSPWTKLPGYDHTLLFVDLMRAVKAVLQQEKIDLVYLRYMPTFGNALGAMKAVKAQGGKLVLEFPTYPREMENQRSLLRRPVFAYADRVLRRLMPLVDLVTAIGQPCGGQVEGRPAMDIVNGVDVERTPLRQAKPPGAEIELLCLASMAGWHGYDRILRALAAYDGGEPVRLHMVGGEGDGSLAAWQRLAQEENLGEKVVFHGPLYAKELDDLVARCDVGIGSLGMFRFGLSQGMTLKQRDYMARGLPFVYAAADPSLGEAAAFSFRVANDESPIAFADILDFARRTRRDPGLPAAMRAYAARHMSWESVLAPVLERVGL